MSEIKDVFQKYPPRKIKEISAVYLTEDSEKDIIAYFKEFFSYETVLTNDTRSTDGGIIIDDKYCEFMIKYGSWISFNPIRKLIEVYTNSDFRLKYSVND